MTDEVRLSAVPQRFIMKVKNDKIIMIEDRRPDARLPIQLYLPYPKTERQARNYGLVQGALHMVEARRSWLERTGLAEILEEERKRKEEEEKRRREGG